MRLGRWSLFVRRTGEGAIFPPRRRRRDDDVAILVSHARSGAAGEGISEGIPAPPSLIIPQRVRPVIKTPCLNELEGGRQAEVVEPRGGGGGETAPKSMRTLP